MSFTCEDLDPDRLLFLIDCAIKELTDGINGIHSKWSLEGIITRRACGPFEALVKLEIKAWEGFREQLTSSGESLEEHRWFVAQVAWHLYFDCVIMIEFKRCLLKALARGFLCLLDNDRVVFCYEQYILPILNRGWSLEFNQAVQLIGEFREFILGEEYLEAAKEELAEKIGFPDLEDWKSWQEIVQSSAGSRRSA